MENTIVRSNSYYIVNDEQIREFELINTKLKQNDEYIDLCKTVMRPECQLFFDFYTFLANDNLFINHERTLNIPIYSFLNEITSKNKQLQQFKQNYITCKETCMMTSMYLNKALQHLIGNILATFNIPMERIIVAIQSLDSSDVGVGNEEALAIQRRILLELKERFVEEDYLNVFIYDAVNSGKSYFFKMLA